MGIIEKSVKAFSEQQRDNEQQRRGQEEREREDFRVCVENYLSLLLQENIQSENLDVPFRGIAYYTIKENNHILKLCVESGTTMKCNVDAFDGRKLLNSNSIINEVNCFEDIGRIYCTIMQLRDKLPS